VYSTTVPITSALLPISLPSGGQDSKSYHERELKAARDEMARARKEAESVLGAAGQQEQAMHTLELEVQELKAAIDAQEQQVGGAKLDLDGHWHGHGIVCVCFCVCTCVNFECVSVYISMSVCVCVCLYFCDVCSYVVCVFLCVYLPTFHVWCLYLCVCVD